MKYSNISLIKLHKTEDYYKNVQKDKIKTVHLKNGF
jgi:hypothetical protein